MHSSPAVTATQQFAKTYCCYGAHVTVAGPNTCDFFLTHHLRIIFYILGWCVGICLDMPRDVNPFCFFGSCLFFLACFMCLYDTTRGLLVVVLYKSWYGGSWDGSGHPRVEPRRVSFAYIQTFTLFCYMIRPFAYPNLRSILGCYFRFFYIVVCNLHVYVDS